MKERFILWLAQGFGSGRVPVSPGTAGSAVGLLWFVALLATNKPILFLIGLVASVPISIWACGEGERILRQKDPGSIVIDEIIAIPMCFSSWLAILFFQNKVWPGPEYFFSAPKWPMTVAVFVLFRIADIAKPWPVRQSQSLRGGIGVTMDDILASGYVNLVIWLAWLLKPVWF